MIFKIPALKYLNLFLRSALTFYIFSLLQASEVYQLMKIISISVLVGLIIGFGGIDAPSLIEKKDRDFLSRFFLASSSLIVIFLAISGYFNNNSNYLIFVSCVSVGLNQWVCGLIRSYKPYSYEMILAFSSTFIWLLLLLALKFKFEYDISYVFISLLFFLCNLIYLFKLSRKYSTSLVNSEIKNLEKPRRFDIIRLYKESFHKFTWDILYTIMTRFPFLGVVTFYSDHKLLPYVYLYCEFLSAGFSHVSTILLSADKYGENQHKNLTNYSILILGVIYIFSIIVFFLLKNSSFIEYENIKKVNHFFHSHDDGLIITLFTINMFLLQSSFIARYKYLREFGSNLLKLNLFSLFFLFLIYFFNYFFNFLTSLNLLLLNVIFAFFLFYKIYSLRELGLKL